DNSFPVREKASSALVALGNVAVPSLRQALTDPDIEIVRRAENCLRLIEKGYGAAVPAAAARALARRKPAGAADVLLGYLPVAENEAVAEEVRKSLVAVAVRDGKPEPALRAALADKLPARRAVAAEVLAHIPDQRPGVLNLLQDPVQAVRLR